MFLQHSERTARAERRFSASRFDAPDDDYVDDIDESMAKDELETALGHLVAATKDERKHLGKQPAGV